jgi:iron(III)-salmochelin esterase
MISRRSLLASLGVLGLDCSRRDRTPPQTSLTVSPPGADAAGAPRGDAELAEWSLDATGSQRAVVVTPAWAREGERFPVLVALHGRGESLKPPPEGAMGWPRDYALTRAMARLRDPPIVPSDLEGFVDEERLAALNRDLAAKPLGGLVVVCPYVPDLDLSREEAMDSYGTFLLEVLLPRARAAPHTLSARESTGIDGVSLGGAVALYVGLTHAEAFGSVGAIQPALHVDDVPAWTLRARAARRKNASLKLRLLTSTEDPFRGVVTRTSEAWHAAGVEHDFVVLPGPHDYVFNRGPGSIELLAWHDRALARP